MILGGDYASPEEESLKTIKKQLKETFERIGRDKEVFD